MQSSSEHRFVNKGAEERGVFGLAEKCGRGAHSIVADTRQMKLKGLSDVRYPGHSVCPGRTRTPVVDLTRLAAAIDLSSRRSVVV